MNEATHASIVHPQELAPIELEHKGVRVILGVHALCARPHVAENDVRPKIQQRRVQFGARVQALVHDSAAALAHVRRAVFAEPAQAEAIEVGLVVPGRNQPLVVEALVLYARQEGLNPGLLAQGVLALQDPVCRVVRCRLVPEAEGEPPSATHSGRWQDQHESHEHCHCGNPSVSQRSPLSLATTYSTELGHRAPHCSATPLSPAVNSRCSDA
mmetsp:Transcript_44193/g.124833  ORF Transcript_44193/g.124833 Transcript_44193/m.124833 type:complete len:213 (+) Transcript_44193:664-1302(+)